MILSLLALPLLFAAANASPAPRSPWQPTLRACINQFTSNGDVYRLVDATTFSQYIQCTYTHDSGGGSSSTEYCWYDYQTYALDHYPNTPLPVDSNANCPAVLPLAQNYLIKTASTGKCITMSGNYDGAPVRIQDCDYRHGNPNQRWHFEGSIIQALGTNKCLDVTDGNSANGAKLQVWTCVDGAANQQFQHWVSNVLVVPEDHISWLLHPFQCLDLTDGNLANGTPIQIWACNYQNPNQKWFIEPSV
ncbi:ricin B lectin domain-containing protein [Crucibulum laeve]|uniref:Ricin B lectin domain-containing protein n=1 Tax=Crucibulum laeve TaxID=68775 RepID=A0A5C3LHX5_9AGAR|nr:ricin B lectin domain-containing protein [Crucibulum laeve]